MKRGACSALLVVSALAPRTHAEFSAEVRPTDWNTGTLRAGEFRLGLFQEEYGVFDSLTVGTYLVPWLLIPVAGGFVGDAYAKWRFFELRENDGRSFSLAARAAVFVANVDELPLRNGNEGALRVAIAPVSLLASYVPADRVTFTLDLTANTLTTFGDFERANSATLFGTGAQGSFQVAFIPEWRVDEHWSLHLVTRLAPYVQDLLLRSELNLSDSTTATVNARLVSEGGVSLPWLIQPGATWSTGPLYVQFGLGYGCLFFPGLRLVGATPTFVPDLDVYFRF